MCCGRTPLKTLKDGKRIWKEKKIAWTSTDRQLLRIGNCQIGSELLHFNGKFREYCLDLNWFATLEDARSTIDDWQNHYNYVRPHRSLGKKPPAVFARDAA